ncbi:hypothetical protein EP7_004991 [Isosphaeraceae bacterium EP7]
MHSTAEKPPLFCPRCRRAARDERGKGLCSQCGDSLQPQGYCEVCESFWPQAAGFECPKHEIALVDSAPGPLITEVPPEGLRLVTVGVYHMPYEAETRRSRLEAEGVPTFLEGARMGAMKPYGGATGGIKLQVPLAYQDEARILLAQSWAPPRYPDDDLDDAWDDLEPDPNATHDEQAHWIAWPLIAVVIFTALVVLMRLLRGA